MLDEEIGMLSVWPEDPLVNGIYNFFKADEALKDIIFIGPSKKGAQLEGSKEFAKQFMERHNIPTAKYQSFNKETLESIIDKLLSQAKKSYDEFNAADGKIGDGDLGVTILNGLEEVNNN